MEPDTCQNDLSLKKKGGEDRGKGRIQRLNKERGRQEMLYWADKDDGSEANPVWPFTLTTNRQQVTTLLVVNGIKFHLNLLESTRSVFLRIKWSIFNIGKNSSENKSILLSYWVIATEDVIFGLQGKHKTQKNV